MVRRFYKGDKVRTEWGDGIVKKVTTWRDRIVDMSDAEAYEFCSVCKHQVGLGFREEWVELLVSVGKRMKKLQAGTVELLEGRDYDEKDGLA